jgi:hypothetical protein
MTPEAAGDPQRRSHPTERRPGRVEDSRLLKARGFWQRARFERSCARLDLPDDLECLAGDVPSSLFGYFVHPTEEEKERSISKRLKRPSIAIGPEDGPRNEATRRRRAHPKDRQATYWATVTMVQPAETA